jgi:hypothetical protein
MVPSNLSTECQRLYGNIAGASITLDTEDFRDFSKAIERSVNTEGLLCQRLLKSKAGEFGKENYKTTYLRITLGADLGNSPGAPYVLEIWPDMHSWVLQTVTAVVSYLTLKSHGIGFLGPPFTTMVNVMLSSRCYMEKSRRTISLPFTILSKSAHPPFWRKETSPGSTRRTTRSISCPTRVSLCFIVKFWIYTDLLVWQTETVRCAAQSSATRTTPPIRAITRTSTSSTRRRLSRVLSLTGES